MELTNSCEKPLFVFFYYLSCCVQHALWFLSKDTPTPFSPYYKHCCCFHSPPKHVMVACYEQPSWFSSFIHWTRLLCQYWDCICYEICEPLNIWAFMKNMVSCCWLHYCCCIFFTLISSLKTSIINLTSVVRLHHKHSAAPRYEFLHYFSTFVSIIYMCFLHHQIHRYIVAIPIVMLG
jgi:hypothetical protein